MKFYLSVFTVMLALLCAVSTASAADIMLPTPEKDGGPSVLAAISERSSAQPTAFRKDEISNKELSTILWAATGRNREGKGWTVPFAMGAGPYLHVYVLLKSGYYIYDPDKNMLKMLGGKNIISRAGRQDFVATAPAVLVLATRGNGPRVDSWAEIAAGAMSQNVYLAAEALGMKTRYIQSYNKETLLNTLQTEPTARILCIMPLGRQ
ncbi:MAG: nitroreductase family protein [Synergistaceae bacterium]|nr:nitroreductase family protein [Synergistaceae bacterium]